MKQFVVVVDDVSQNLWNQELPLVAVSSDHAYAIAQQTFPYGLVKHVHTASEWQQMFRFRTLAEQLRLCVGEEPIYIPTGDEPVHVELPPE